MKMYNPEKKDSFQMQFGFRSPSWKPRSKNEYIKIKDRDNDKRKFSSNISKLDE